MLFFRSDGLRIIFYAVSTSDAELERKQVRPSEEEGYPIHPPPQRKEDAVVPGSTVIGRELGSQVAALDAGNALPDAFGKIEIQVVLSLDFGPCGGKRLRVRVRVNLIQPEVHADNGL